RPTDGTWYWLTSGTGYDNTRAGSKQWGIASLGDIPMVGDIDGDGRTDLIVWRASTGTWFWLTSTTGYFQPAAGILPWGDPSLGDVPMLGDYDGDGRQALGVWRASTGEWHWLTSSTNFSLASARSVKWGDSSQGDKPFTGDIDGDGRSELIIWRPG